MSTLEDLVGIKRGSMISSDSSAPDWFLEAKNYIKRDPGRDFLFGGVADWLQKTAYGQKTSYLDNVMAGMDLAIPGVDDVATKAVLPQVAGLAGMILGKKSRGADLAALARAVEMKALNKTEDEIYDSTGWWLNHPDGKPRYETSDHGIDFVDYDANELVDDWLRDNGSEYSEGLVRDRIRRPGLDGEYDYVRNTKLEANLNPEGYGPDAYVVPGENKIRVKDWRNTDEFLDNIVHEDQHLVQSEENFDRGGDDRWISEMSSNLMARTDELSTIFGWKNLNPVELKKTLYNEGYTFDQIAGIEAKLEDYTTEGILQEAERIGKELDLLRHTSKSELFQKYLDIAGEEEARLVARRRNMTKAERMERPFYKEYETPLDRQIRLQPGDSPGEWKLANFEKKDELMPFDLDPTSDKNVPNIQELFSNPEYFAEKKGIKGEVKWMSPDEYLQEAERVQRELGGSGSDSWLQADKVKEYASAMKKGDKFPMLDIDWSRPEYPGQEGRHRALAAKALGMEKVPVIVRSQVNK